MQKHGFDKDDRKKRWKFGQNFLVDEGIIREIVGDVDCRREDWIVEIGPGQGALTRRIAPHVAKLTALEIDPKWVEHVRKHPEWGNVEVIHTDATRADVDAILARNAPAPGVKPKVVGNLPYNRAAPILFRFLPLISRYHSMQIMVQYEVGKRICANPHSRDFGFLSVFIQNFAVPEMLRKITPDAFRPRPKVLSAIVRLTPLPQPLTTEPMFLRFVEMAFAQKRKKLTNSLQPFYPREKVAEALRAISASENVRAEDLSVAEFVEAFKILGPPPGVLARRQSTTLGLDEGVEGMMDADESDFDGSEEDEE